MPDRTSGDSTRSAVAGQAITTNVAFEACISLNCSADVLTATVTMKDGDVIANFPLHKGYNPVQATKVVFTGAVIVALYN